MVEEKFYSPSNRVLGAIGLLVGLAALVAIVLEGPDLGEWVAIFGIVLAMTLVWAFLVRPEIRLGAERLTLRNPLVRHDIPLQLVTGIEVRRWTIVLLRDGKLTSSAVSRGRLELARHDRVGPPDLDATSVPGTADLMTARIRARLDESELLPLPDDAEVRRTPAWPELAVIGVAALGLVITLLL